MGLEASLLQKSSILGDSLPRDLGGGLILRTATAADADSLAQFNGRIHGVDHFDAQVAIWTRDFCSENHPTCGPTNVTIVEDTHFPGKIVSTMCLIPQVWTYGGIPIEVGRIEAVGTDLEYRRRGLTRSQIEVHHARSAAREHLIQGITGIPWFYRRFGYEYALDLGGGRSIQLASIPALKEGESELYRLRPMRLDDLPFVMPLYEREAAQFLVSCPRSEQLWRYLLTGISHLSTEERPFQMIERGGTPVGYVAPSAEMYREMYAIREAAVAPGESLRAVMSSVLPQLKALAETVAKEQNKTVQVLYFQLGSGHPLYGALREYWTRDRPPHGWYIRVPDTAALIRRIAPVLEKRLAASGMAGHTGELKINEYNMLLRLNWQEGKLRSVKEEAMSGETEWQPAFPPRTFLKLLFGYRSQSEIKEAFADCFSWGDAELLLDILFPKQPSQVIPLG